MCLCEFEVDAFLSFCYFYDALDAICKAQESNKEKHHHYYYYFFILNPTQYAPFFVTVWTRIKRLND